MTDFLANLVDRALNRAPVLQRRRPSLFEPAPDTVALGGVQFEYYRPQEKDETVSELESRRSQREFALGAKAPTLHAEPSIRSHSSPSESAKFQSVRHGNRLPLEVPSQSVAKRASERSSPTVSPIPNQPKRMVGEDEAKLRSVQTERSSPEKIETAPRRVIETIVEREVAMQQSSRRADAETRERNEKKTVVVQTSGPNLREENKTRALAPDKNDLKDTIKPKQPATKPPLAPRAVSRSQPVIIQQAQPVAPTVQVTIGRIEVRATPPAPQLRVAPPAAPKLSLEDYLRSRSGGSK